MIKRLFLLGTIVVLFTSGLCPAFAQDDPGRRVITPENAVDVVLLHFSGNPGFSGKVWSPDGTLLVAGTSQGVMLYDAYDLLAPPRLLRAPEMEVVERYAYGGDSLAFVDDGNTLMVGHGSWVDFWDIPSGELQASYYGEDISLGTADFNAARNLLLTANGSGVNEYTFLVAGASSQTEDIVRVRFMESPEDVTSYLILNYMIVHDVALSPDGQYAVIAMAATGDSAYSSRVSNDIFVWNTDHVLSGDPGLAPEPDFKLQGHTQPVYEIIYSPDGSLLVSAGLDGTIRLWHMPEGTPGHVLDAHLAAVWDISLNADASLLASAGGDGTIRLWNVQTGELLHTFDGFGGYMWLAAISPDGTRIAARGYDDGFQMLDAQTGAVLDAFPGRNYGYLRSVAYHPDGRTIAAGGGENNVVLWDVEPDESYAAVRQLLEGHQGPVYDVMFSPDGTLLASGSSDHTVRLWDIHTGAEIAILEAHTGSVFDVTFSPDGRLLASGSFDGTARLWDVSGGELLVTLDSPYPVYSVAFSPDGRLLAYGDTHLWDCENGVELAQWDTSRTWSDSYTSGISQLAFSPDGSQLVNGARRSTYVWTLDTLNQEPVLAIGGSPSFILLDSLSDLENPTEDPAWFSQSDRDIAFSPDHTMIVSAGSSLTFWGLPD